MDGRGSSIKWLVVPSTHYGPRPRVSKRRGLHPTVGVLPIAICLSEDTGAANTFAVGEQLDFPMLYDWGTYHASRQEETSPVANAYRADHLPRLVITDRRRRVRTVLDGLTTYEGSDVDTFLEQRLEEEPE